MLDQNTKLAIALVMFLSFLFGVGLSHKIQEPREENVVHDVVFLQSQGEFWFSNDTAYYVKEGTLNSSELEVLKNLAYEKEVVIFSDLRE